MRKTISIIAGLVLLVPLILVLWSFAEMGINNYRLSNFAVQLFEYALPIQTEVLEKKSDVGLLTGNGNHCDFIARMTVKTALSKKEVEQHYSRIAPQQAISGSSSEVHLVVSSLGEGTYLVEVVDAPNNPGFDWRCH